MMEHSELKLDDLYGKVKLVNNVRRLRVLKSGMLHPDSLDIIFRHSLIKNHGLTQSHALNLSLELHSKLKRKSSSIFLSLGKRQFLLEIVSRCYVYELLKLSSLNNGTIIKWKIQKV